MKKETAYVNIYINISKSISLKKKDMRIKVDNVFELVAALFSIG